MATRSYEVHAFRIGDEVKITQLNSKPEYNDKTGKIVGPFLSDTKRWPVEINISPNTTAKAAIKTEHLSLQAPTPSDILTLQQQLNSALSKLQQTKDQCDAAMQLISTLSLNNNDNTNIEPPQKEYIDVDELPQKPVITKRLSLVHIPDETGFQTMLSDPNLHGEKVNIISTVAQKHNAIKLPPSISRQLSVPKMMASKNFLGTSSYRETVLFLLAFAVFRLHPQQQLVVENVFQFGINKRSYLCRFTSFCITKEHIQEIEQEMKKISKMELELKSKFVGYDACLELLKATNQRFSAKLVQSLNSQCFRMVGVDLDDGNDAFYILQYRSTLTNTKYCNEFSLYPSDDYKCKFILKFPHNDMIEIDEKENEAEDTILSQPKAITDLYAQGEKMSQILKIKCVADINIMIQSGRFKELMLISEAYHNRQIVHCASAIHDKDKTNDIKIILISGPSSSGKTTFASKLGIQLHLLGMVPTLLEVDMFSKNREDPTHPRDENGNLNFEVIEAVKLQELNETILKIVEGKSVRMPIFDFTVGRRTGYQKQEIALDQANGVLIMEGIFCLNPKLFDKSIIKNIDDISYKIFICPITPFYALDNFHFISEQITRLVRRISRDHFHRGNAADHTVFKWGQLKAGEDVNIFPFVKYADTVFNSSLLYEVPVLKVYSYPLLQSVTRTSPQYKDAQNLLEFLDCFLTMPDNFVPSDSLLMEFIGTSVFDEI